MWWGGQKMKKKRKEKACNVMGKQKQKYSINFGFCRIRHDWQIKEYGQELLVKEWR